jgi:hypothetical protein
MNATTQPATGMAATVPATVPTAARLTGSETGTATLNATTPPVTGTAVTVRKKTGQHKFSLFELTKEDEKAVIFK